MLWRTSGLRFVYHPIQAYQPSLFITAIWTFHIIVHPSPNKYQYMRLHANGKLNQCGSNSTINPKRKSSIFVSRFLKMINSGIQHNGSVNNTASYQLQLGLFPELRDALSDARIIIQMAEELIDTGNIHNIILLLRLAYSEGTTLDQNVYEQIVYRLARGRHWQELLDVVVLGKKQIGGSTRQLLNWRARALVETKSFTLVGKVLEEFAKQHTTPDRRTFQIVIEGHLRNHDLHQASIALKAMENAGFTVDPSIHMTIANAYRGLGPNTDVQRHAYEVSKQACTSLTVTTLNTLVLQCLEEKDLDGALYLLNSQPRSENERSIQPESHQSSSLASWPTSYTFSLFIDYFARERDMPRMAEFLHHMKVVGVTPDSNVAAALIRAYYANNLEISALEVLSEICKGSPIEKDISRWIKPSTSDLGPFKGGLTIEVFNAWIQGSLKLRGVKALDSIFWVMKAARLSPNVATITVMLSNMARCEDLDPKEFVRMARLLRRFANVPVQSATSFPIIHQLFRTILRRMINRVRKRSWNISALRLRTEGRRPLANQHIIKDSSDFSAGLVGLGDNFKVIPHNTMQSLSLRDVKSDRAMIALRIRHDAVVKQDMESAQSVFNDMLVRGMRPTAYHYAALMEGYTILGDMTAAKETLKRAEANGIKPNAVMHTILIVGYARKGKPEQAVRSFHSMIHQGIEPDFAAVDAAVSAFYIVGEFRLARQVILDLWPLVAPFPEELREASLKELVHALRALRRNPTSVHVASREKQRSFLKKMWSVTLRWRPKFRNKTLLPRPEP